MTTLNMRFFRITFGPSVGWNISGLSNSGGMSMVVWYVDRPSEYFLQARRYSSDLEVLSTMFDW